MQRLSVFSLAFFLVLQFGCGDESSDLPPGSISVGWRVGTSGCAASGITTVGIQVEGGELSSPLTRSFDCSDASATISDLQPGTYNLTLWGKDAGGVSRFSGAQHNIQIRSEGVTQVGTVQLSALPASIYVTWYFENGRMCAQNDVTQVTVTLFDTLEYEQASTTTNCGNGEATLDDIDADEYVVDVVATDQDSIIRFDGQQSVTVERGDHAEVEIELTAVGE